jgi:arylformamidase
MGRHTGTHVDAPYHFLKDGPRLTGGARPQVGPCRGRPPWSAGDRRRPCTVSTSAREILVCLTDNSAKWASPAFQRDFVYVTKDGGDALLERGVHALGMDYLSIEEFGSPDFPVHHRLLGAGVFVIEGLDLGQVTPGRYYLVCLPLISSRRAPARAVLMGGSGVGERWVRVIADDLTGACDVAAALLPSRRRVVVGIDAVGDADARRPEHPESHVRAGGRGVCVRRARRLSARRDRRRAQKIDTALRDISGPAPRRGDGRVRRGPGPCCSHPEAGRTTVGGVLLWTACLSIAPRCPRSAEPGAGRASPDDRLHRRDARDVGRARRSGATASRRSSCGRRATASRWWWAMRNRRRPARMAGGDGDTIVLAGSTARARVARGRVVRVESPQRGERADGAGGILVVAGSAHPVGRGQLAHLERSRRAGRGRHGADVAALVAGLRAAASSPRGPDDSTTAAARRYCAAGRDDGARHRRGAATGDDPRRGRDCLRGAGRARSSAARRRRTPAPLAVRATVLDGVLAGMPLVTKGGSTGPPERLADLIAEVR